MRVKLNTKLDKAINKLDPISPLNINKKVIYFLNEGYTPDEYGYLQRNGKYIKILEEGIAIVPKNSIWKNGIVKDKNACLLHIDD